MATQTAELSSSTSTLSTPFYNGKTPSPVQSSSDDDEQIVWKQGINGVNGAEKSQVKQASPVDGLGSAEVVNPSSKWHFTDGGQIIDPRTGDAWELADGFGNLQIKEDDGKPISRGPGSGHSDVSDRAKSAGSRRGTEGSRRDSPTDVAPTVYSHVTKGVESNARKMDGEVPDYVRRSPTQIRGDQSRTNPSQGFIGSQENRYHNNDARPSFGLPSGRAAPYNGNGVLPSPHHPLLHQAGSALHSPLTSGFPAHIQTGHSHIPQPQYSPHHVPHPRGNGRMEEFDISSVMPKNGFPVTNGVMPPGGSFHPGAQDHSASPYELSLAHRGSYGAGTNAQGYHSPVVHSPPPIPGTSIYGPHLAHLAGNPYGSPPPHPYPHPYPASATSYDMIVPGTGMDDPTRAALTATLANRAQFRTGHQHSASDSATLRDSSVLMGADHGFHLPQHQPNSPLSQQTHAHSHSLSLSHSLSHSPYSPQLPASPYHPHSPGPYAGYYGHIPPPPLPHQPNVMSHLSSSYPASIYGAVPPPTVDPDNDPSLPPIASPGSAGPSANNRKLGLYKTELCRSWEEKGSCRYGTKCQFAHGEDEIRKVSRHPKYKTEICRTFWVSGSCPYGKRCCFVHTELPSGTAPGAPGAAADGARGGSTPGSTGNSGTPNTSAPPDGRARSMSTNSDPNDAPSSLLARITAKAHANSAAAAAAAANRSSDASPANANGQYDVPSQTAIANAYAQYGRPAQSTLRVETTAPLEDTFSSSKGLPNFSTTSATTTSGHTNGSHHRVSASVDFSSHTRHLGDGFEFGGRVGMGHQRNPSASSVVLSTFSTQIGSDSIPKSSSRTPDPRLSGHSTPFGVSSTNESSLTSSITPARGSPAPASTTRSFMHERTASGGFNLGSAYMERSWA